MNTLRSLLEDDSRLSKRHHDRAGLASIASLLLQVRHEMSLSQKEFASRAGLTKTMISELENSANDGVTLRTLTKIAKAANASLDLQFRCDCEQPGVVSASLLSSRLYAGPTSVNLVERRSDADIAELAA